MLVFRNVNITSLWPVQIPSIFSFYICIYFALNSSSAQPATGSWPCNVQWIAYQRDRSRNRVNSRPGFKSPPRKHTITQITRDRSWVPRAALAYFPSAPPTPLRAKQAPPAPLSSFRPISSCQRLEMQEQKNANSFFAGWVGGSTQRVRSRDHLSSVIVFFFFFTYKICLWLQCTVILPFVCLEK